MSSRRTRSALAALALGASLLAAGCRNPFMPDSDVSLIYVLMNNLGDTQYPLVEMPVFAGDFPGVSANYTPYGVTTYFEVRNKVAVTITSVNIAYTDMAGNPVTSYAAAGGKYMKLQTRLNPDSDAYPGGTVTGIALMVLDRYVVAQLEDPAFSPKYINVELTFRGEDENGYDVKLTGRFSIKGMNF